MKKIRIQQDSGFHVVLKKDRAEAASMLLESGESTGGPDNRHETSDQWMYVISGRAQAVVGGSETALSPGDLILIEKGETHEITNTSSFPFQTINIYVPPAY